MIAVTICPHCRAVNQMFPNGAPGEMSCLTCGHVVYPVTFEGAGIDPMPRERRRQPSIGKIRL